MKDFLLGKFMTRLYWVCIIAIPLAMTTNLAEGWWPSWLLGLALGISIAGVISSLVPSRAKRGAPGTRAEP